MIKQPPATILTFEDLQQLTGYTKRSGVERALRKQGIRWFWGRHGPWTTIEMVNQAGGQAADDEQYDSRIL
ncbi:TPA: DUF4224 domain-containing protein [Pseudomonas aeruginosa]|mgnify:FL=1|uniref:DUF4224 domain-containing protein n=1 Tax=Pseudomonas aeruginosa TaxID=287 RepID=UPI0003C3B6EF|nr:DUF4224 domain-containing protein [Pseudomonas aeruginosa]HCL2783345.1 DUF4224 domain-containing protein [Pseudomonas aeruginosa AC9A]AMA40351.1 hypothetical protein DPADHS01_31150 [Pseudomonas aeruginosa DHS01]AWE86377.1 hypothetical protein CSC29_5669 [Pseudomonas aeruginosa]EIU5017238.1 DUF4224 domain-containing protein [Pseudomonas aeruginosa]EIZ7651325.1 DUF4224 domain-containing protein [Pseudomonas aeruginosa]